MYLPISAYIDSTQRWMLFGHIDSNFTGFVQEVTPHEVAHQWFGHGVGWASYHDQWLSEGFADFAAGLFLQQAVGPKWQKDYLEYWQRQHERILEKNNFGVAPNDAGPLWLGIAAGFARVAAGLSGRHLFERRVCPADAAFADVRRSGGKRQSRSGFHRHDARLHGQSPRSPASTESFKAIAEKHMTKPMDLQHNGRLDWFFDEWVYGTHVPRYAFKYEMQPRRRRQAKVHVEITQSEVDDNFAMFVPVFADFGEGHGAYGPGGNGRKFHAHR